MFQDRDEPAARLQRAEALADCAEHVVDVLQRVLCDHEIEARITERKRGRVGDPVVAHRIGLEGVTD
jgi:hypothetical protein